jgi:hypothetical protein
MKTFCLSFGQYQSSTEVHPGTWPEDLALSNSRRMEAKDLGRMVSTGNSITHLEIRQRTWPNLSVLPQSAHCLEVLVAPYVYLQDFCRLLGHFGSDHGLRLGALKEVVMKAPGRILSEYSLIEESLNGFALEDLKDLCPALQRVVQKIEPSDRPPADAWNLYASDMQALAHLQGLDFIVDTTEEVREFYYEWEWDRDPSEWESEADTEYKRGGSAESESEYEFFEYGEYDEDEESEDEFGEGG